MGGGEEGGGVVSYDETTRLRLIFLNGQSRQAVRKTEKGSGFLFTHSLINRRTDHTKLLTLSHLDALRRKIAPPPSFDLPPTRLSPSGQSLRPLLVSIRLVRHGDWQQQQALLIRRNAATNSAYLPSALYSVTKIETGKGGGGIDMNPVCKRPQRQGHLFCFTVFVLFLLVFLPEVITKYYEQ